MTRSKAHRASLQTVSVIETLQELEAFIPEWTEFYLQTETPNPFAHPAWLATWARHFVGPDRLQVVLVRSHCGDLLGVAPFYRVERRIGTGLCVTQLRLLGSGPAAYLTEMPQILAQPGEIRRVIRGVVEFLLERHQTWDFLELTISQEQGWFEPGYIPAWAARQGAQAVHLNVRPCVVLPLAGTWEDLWSSFRRKTKDRVLRGPRKLAEVADHWRVSTPKDDRELDDSIRLLVRLHQERSRSPHRLSHSNYLKDPRTIDFLRDAAGQMFAAGSLTPYTIEIQGRAAAVHLTLHANRTLFFSLSAFDRAWGNIGIPTTIVAQGLRDAIDRGDTLANLSIGPNEFQLLWSNQVETHHDYLVIAPKLKARLAAAVYLQARTLKGMRSLFSKEGRGADIQTT